MAHSPFGKLKRISDYATLAPDWQRARNAARELALSKRAIVKVTA
jgi:hypothetical protein